jgi:hypothetical protein
MLIGRWSSDAFMRYIRKQIPQFSNDVARRMTQKPVFFTVGHASRSDPHTAQNPASFTGNIGMGSSGTDTTSGRFAVWDSEITAAASA